MTSSLFQKQQKHPLLKLFVGCLALIVAVIAVLGVKKGGVLGHFKSFQYI